MAPAYHKIEGVSLHSEVCAHSLQYDGKCDGRFVVRVWMCNLGCLSGKGGEVCEELGKRMIDVCCFQEEKWRGPGARMLGMN